jgi:ribonuclease HIII
VTAGFLADREVETRLRALGVRDSKELGDGTIKKIAGELSSLFPDRIAVCEILPSRYNELYTAFRSKGKKLNSLLAWSHAKVIQELAADGRAEGAIADQFGDESYILDEIAGNKTMTAARRLKLIQRPRAEENLAVAAASILARARFARRIGELSERFGFDIPKGGGADATAAARRILERHGEDGLRTAVKMHFKNTGSVIQL